MEFIRQLNEQGVKVYSIMEGEIMIGTYYVISLQVLNALMNFNDLKVPEVVNQDIKLNL